MMQTGAIDIDALDGETLGSDGVGDAVLVGTGNDDSHHSYSMVAGGLWVTS